MREETSDSHMCLCSVCPIFCLDSLSGHNMEPLLLAGTMSGNCHKDVNRPPLSDPWCHSFPWVVATTVLPVEGISILTYHVLLTFQSSVGKATGSHLQILHIAQWRRPEHRGRTQEQLYPSSAIQLQWLSWYPGSPYVQFPLKVISRNPGTGASVCSTSSQLMFLISFRHLTPPRTGTQVAASSHSRSVLNNLLPISP